MPALKCRVSYLLHLEEETNILKTSHFATLVRLFPNISLHIKVNKNIKKCILCLISWLVHSSLYRRQSFSLSTRPQKITTSACITFYVRDKGLEYHSKIVRSAWYRQILENTLFMIKVKCLFFFKYPPIFYMVYSSYVSLFLESQILFFWDITRKICTT